MKHPLILLVSTILTCSLSTAKAIEISSNHVSQGTIKKILSQGVPEVSLKRILSVMDGQFGPSEKFDSYYCRKKGPMTTHACAKSDRIPEERDLDLGYHRYAISVDFSLASTKKRLYFIDLETGEVEKHHVSHGIGSSPELSDGELDTSGVDGLYATKFSNIDNSKMTSLGLYLVGGTYKGKYGETLRMYGIEDSNDQAYMRDIVFHGAYYAREKHIGATNNQLKPPAPFGRLGVSWGCPAISPEAMQKIRPLMKWGGIMDHYHPKFIK